MPVQEYCFLWIDWWPMCMTKAEWSGWMQAIGSVLAIFGAFIIANLQRKLLLEKDINDKILRSGVYRPIFNKVEEYTLNLKKSLANHQGAEWLLLDWEDPADRYNKVELKSLVNLIAEIDIGNFYDPAESAALLDLKISLVEIMKTMDFLSGLDKKQLTHYYKNLPEYDYQIYQDEAFDRVTQCCAILLK